MPILDGATYTTFVVSLSKPPTEPVTVAWKTLAVTAIPDQDYKESAGELVFLPTETQKTVQVLVYGRASGDNAARTFRIELQPAPNVVLGLAATDLVISVVDEEDAIVATTTFARGRDGLTNYEIAKLNGYEGTAADWIEDQIAPTEAATAATAAAVAATGNAITATGNANAATATISALIGPTNAAKDAALAAAAAGSTILAAKDVTLQAAAEAKVDASAYRGSGIEAGLGVESYADLPEGRAKLLFALADEFKRLLAAVDASGNWLTSGLRLLSGGKLLLNRHQITTADSLDWPVQITDEAGKPFALMDRARRWWFEKLTAVDGITTPRISSPEGTSDITFGEANWPWAITDEDGNAFLGIRDDDVHLMHVGGSKRLGLLFDDARNRTRTDAIMTVPHNLKIARPDKQRALVAGDGQSLSTAVEAWPAITTDARRTDTFMIGLSVRAANNTSTGGWTPQGGSAVLTPLIATVEPITGTARVPMSSGDVAAINPASSASYEGENAIVAVTNGLARAWEEKGGPTIKWIGASAGYGGTSIENLQIGTQKGKRLEDLIDLHKTLAVAAGESWNLLGLRWTQGEENYKNDGGSGTATKDGYKAQLTTFYDNLKTFTAGRGQAVPPPMFLDVTAGSYVNDAVEASISMAQVEFALETPGAFVIGPNYPYTDKGGHLDSNGARWMGLMGLKLMRRVLIDRLGHDPFYPTKIEVEGRWAYVHMGGAVGPIRFAPNYTVADDVLYSDGGFRAKSGSNWIGVEKVETIAATIAAIKFESAVNRETDKLWYADRAVHLGNGNLCDSDPTRAQELYEYFAGGGMYASANIAELVNKPYPMANWCPPFVLPFNYSR